ncbi:hypothetical protein VH22019_00045 [Vibrio phage VH2_2019]|nr:hypothetical protein VH22019_00045 [Vibrio phage VH2_2019]
MINAPTRKKRSNNTGQHSTKKPERSIEGKSLSEIAESSLKTKTITERKPKVKYTSKDNPDNRPRSNASTPDKLRQVFGLTEEECAKLGESDMWVPKPSEWTGQYQVLNVQGDAVLARCICGAVEEMSLHKVQDAPSCRHVGSKEAGMANDKNKGMYRRWRRLMAQTLTTPEVVSEEWRSVATFAREAEYGVFPHAQLTRLDDQKPWGKGNTFWVTRGTLNSITPWMYHRVIYNNEARTIIQMLVLIEADLRRCATHYKRNQSVEMLWTWAKKEFAQ